MAIQNTFFSNSFDRVRSMRDVSPMDLFNDAILGVSNALLAKNDEMDALANPYSDMANEQESYAPAAPAASSAPTEAENSFAFETPTSPFSRPTPMASTNTVVASESTPFKGAYSLTSFVKEFEGFNPKAYGDFKQTSIGYGTRARPGETMISKDEAERRLASELDSSRRRVLQHAQKFGYQFTEKQLDALTSFDYNTGRLEQLTAKGTRTPEVIAKQMLQYNKAGGKVLPGLVRRRKAESSLFQSP